MGPVRRMGGPIAMVKNGDPIVIDVQRRRLDVEIPQAGMKKRLRPWTRPKLG